MQRTIDVLAVGELNPDLILSGIAAEGPVLGTEQSFVDQTLTLGSSTAIACVLMQRLGLRTALAAKVGDDDYGRFCLGVLDAEGVDRSSVRVAGGESTGVTVSLSYARDRLLLTRYGTMTSFCVEDVDLSLVGRSRHLHSGSFFIQSSLRLGLPKLFKQAKNQGATTSLDLGWDPSGTWDVESLARVLPYTDVILPNRVELEAVTGTPSVEEGLERLHRMGAGEIALKLGAEGSLVSMAGERQVHTGYNITVADTTGAGDAFNAGYIRARLGGAAPRDRLRLANACGAATAGATGGIGGLPGIENAVAIMDRAGEAMFCLADSI